MRLSLARLAVPAITLALVVAAPAQAGMDCFGNRGGRAVCVESSHSIIDRLDEKARERQLIARDAKLVRKVAEAVHEGRCSDALVLAVKAKNPNVVANTARLCGVPEAPGDKTQPVS